MRSGKLLGVLEQLSGEPMLLFKEKINYKLAGSGKRTYTVHILSLCCSDEFETGGFAPHIDAVAYTHVKMIKHLTILLAVDASNMTNGGLEVVHGSHLMEIPVKEDDHCIEADWVKNQQWTPVELDPGKTYLPSVSILLN